MKLNRRKFLQNGFSAAAGISLVGLRMNHNLNEMLPVHGADSSREQGWYSLADGKIGRIIKDPGGQPFFSIGFNHIDPVPLRRNEFLHIWNNNFENNMEKWLERVHKDLLSWGFNSIGWVQEVVVRKETMRRHSRNFTFEEYQWLDMPYCHMLPFSDFHQWEVETRNLDFFSPEFEEWCDYVAREHCTRMANDPKLIGYFYIDCPTWVHIMFKNPVKGAIVDPEEYKTPSGKKKLYKIAEQYYKVTHDSIRRYDKNHLIFGDRYEANRPIAFEVIEAALPYVDILSFQHFNQPETIVANLRSWHEQTGKPTLLADFGHNENIEGSDYRTHNTEKYIQTIEMLRKEPSCIGLHLCGAYISNRARRRGVIDEYGNYYNPEFSSIVKANNDTVAWVAKNR